MSKKSNICVVHSTQSLAGPARMQHVLGKSLFGLFAVSVAGVAGVPFFHPPKPAPVATPASVAGTEPVPSTIHTALRDAFPASPAIASEPFLGISAVPAFDEIAMPVAAPAAATVAKAAAARPTYAASKSAALIPDASNYVAGAPNTALAAIVIDGSAPLPPKLAAVTQPPPAGIAAAASREAPSPMASTVSHAVRREDAGQTASELLPPSQSVSRVPVADPPLPDRGRKSTRNRVPDKTLAQAPRSKRRVARPAAVAPVVADATGKTPVPSPERMQPPSPADIEPDGITRLLAALERDNGAAASKRNPAPPMVADAMSVMDKLAGPGLPGRQATPHTSVEPPEDPLHALAALAATNHGMHTVAHSDDDPAGQVLRIRLGHVRDSSGVANADAVSGAGAARAEAAPGGEVVVVVAHGMEPSFEPVFNAVDTVTAGALPGSPVHENVQVVSTDTFGGYTDFALMDLHDGQSTYAGVVEDDGRDAGFALAKVPQLPLWAVMDLEQNRLVT